MRRWRKLSAQRSHHQAAALGDRVPVFITLNEESMVERLLEVTTLMDRFTIHTEIPDPLRGLDPV